MKHEDVWNSAYRTATLTTLRHAVRMLKNSESLQEAIEKIEELKHAEQNRP